MGKILPYVFEMLEKHFKLLYFFEFKYNIDIHNIK